MVWTINIWGTFKVLIIIANSIFYQWYIFRVSQIISSKDILNRAVNVNTALYKYLFSDNEIFERMGPKQSDFSMGIQIYVYLAVLQTHVLPLKTQKVVYFFWNTRYDDKSFISFIIKNLIKFCIGRSVIKSKCNRSVSSKVPSGIFWGGFVLVSYWLFWWGRRGKQSQLQVWLTWNVVSDWTGFAFFQPARFMFVSKGIMKTSCLAHSNVFVLTLSNHRIYFFSSW